jgi:hypothetical protein
VIGVGPKTRFPAASWTWTVTSHDEPGVLDVVGVFTHELPVIASFAAGPADSTDAVAEPDVSPGTDAVTVQLPGAPVVVSVVAALLAPCAIVAVVGDTVQIEVLSTLNVTVCVVEAGAVAPVESFSVAVTAVVFGVPAGNSDWPRATSTRVAAPAAVNVTVAVQPLRFAVAAES